MAWILVPSLVSLRSEFNEVAPARDRASDGAIGDGEHSQNSSDHNPDETGKTPSEDADSVNEVHAIDVDNTGPWPAGMSMEKAVQVVVLRHRTGLDDRLQNVIYNRRIWSRSWGWTAREYTGPNPHDHHAHFSSRYTTAQESDRRPWGLLAQFGDVVLQSDIDEIVTTTTTKVVAALKPVITAVVGDVLKGIDTAPLRNGRTVGGSINALVAESGDGVVNVIERETAARFDEVTKELTAVRQSLTQTPPPAV